MAAIRVVTTVVEEIDTAGLEQALRASRLKAAELSRRIGANEQFISQLVNGRVKQVPLERFDALIDAMVGEGDFKEFGRSEVLSVVRGKALLRPTLRLVGDDEANDITESIQAGSGYRPFLADSVAA
jgi:Cro/C1-type helix-turn-helix DNA-binding protein